MRRRTHSVRAHLDRLEARDVPAGNLTVSFSAVTHTLTVIGDATGDSVTVDAVPADNTRFTLTSTADTFNNSASPYTSSTGVKNFVFKMGAGADSITFDNASGPITVEGSVTISGGDGANTVLGTDLTVAKNLSVINGTATAGQTQNVFTNLSVGGSVTIRSAGGDTNTSFSRNVAGVSTIKGNLSVTNGTGSDGVNLADTNVGHNVTINNGHGNSFGFAGFFQVHNQFNTAFRSVIGGSVTVTDLDGNGSGGDGIWDTEVMGNVTFNHGSGYFLTALDGLYTHLPVLIHGNLSILGTGANSFLAGYSSQLTGLDVGGKFTVRSGGGTAESAYFYNAHVGGSTAITLGNGGNTVVINNSEFDGTFTLLSGSGADTISLETFVGTSAATVFKKAVLIDLGAGVDTANDVSNGSNTPDAGEALVVLSTFVYKNVEDPFNAFGDEYFLNGGHIQFE